MMTAEQKQSINFAGVVQAAGVELKKSGNRLLGLCPFHPEKTPSFTIFPGGRYHCFGCGESGDVIDFTRKVYGLDFRGAIRHLGIESGQISPKQRKEIADRKRHQKLASLFQAWVDAAITDLGAAITSIYEKASRWKTVDDFGAHVEILEPLDRLQYYWEILIGGEDEERIELFREWRRGGVRF